VAEVNTGGGANVGGDVNTEGGAVTERDSIAGGTADNRNQINIILENNDRLIELKEQIAKIEDRSWSDEGSIHARLSRLEQHIDWKFELMARDLATFREELAQQKMRQSNNPTWFQVFMVIVAAAMIILLITFIVQLSAVQKRADAVRAQEITQQHLPK